MITVIHGPNLNFLGKREPDVYGSLTLDEINQRLVKIGKAYGVTVETGQYNSEGALIDALYGCIGRSRGVILNAAGYTHTSVAIRDTVAAIQLPVIEVHLSNIYAREEFRHKSMIAPVCTGSISGFGWRSYQLALFALVQILGEGMEIPDRLPTFTEHKG